VQTLGSQAPDLPYFLPVQGNDIPDRSISGPVKTVEGPCGQIQESKWAVEKRRRHLHPCPAVLHAALIAGHIPLVIGSLLNLANVFVHEITSC
jgi:hypothetical protein